MPNRYRGTADERLALDTYVKLVRAAESVTSRLGSRLADLDLTHSQFGVLEALLHLGPLCQKELGEKILKSSGNVTMVVDNLEKGGLVERVRSREDRRRIAVHLTAKGREIIERVFPDHAKAVAREMGVLSQDEQEMLGRLCKRVGKGMAT